MKGIYLTQDGVKEIEAKISDLSREESDEPDYSEGFRVGMLGVLREILHSATILPVVESWEYVDENTHSIPKAYPNGVIINNQ